MNIPLLRDIEYPESDGKPMAETPIHMRGMIALIEDLNDWYAEDPKVYVWGNMFLYYVQGDPRKSVSPDVMVIKGVDKNKYRDVFKTWEEKRTPSLAIEVTSRKTKKEDLQGKFELYRDVLKVKEYILFDPKAEYLKPPLQGFRLRAGEYQPIKELAGRLPSKVLGLHLERQGELVRLWNPQTQSWLPTREDKTAVAEATAALERRLREQLEANVELECRLREQADASAALERRLREQADAENERLRREIEALKQQKRD